MLLPASITRPTIREIPLAEGLRTSPSGFIAQRKMDGRFELLEWNKCLVAGERMRDGGFYAFDAAIIQGDDCRRSPFRDRLAALRHIAAGFPAGMKLVQEGAGGEFLEAVLADGGEGVVFKNPDGYWGIGQWKCKRQETFDVVVAAIHRGSAEIAYEGHPAGKVPICGAKPAVGSIIEISAMCRTASGKFREPRFIRCRPDKN